MRQLIRSQDNRHEHNHDKLRRVQTLKRDGNQLEAVLNSVKNATNSISVIQDFEEKLYPEMPYGSEVYKKFMGKI